MVETRLHKTLDKLHAVCNGFGRQVKEWNTVVCSRVAGVDQNVGAGGRLNEYTPSVAGVAK